MTITLGSDLQAIIEELVRDGRYESPEAAVADGIRILKQYYIKLEWLRRELQIGLDELDRGDVGDWDPDEMKGRIMALYGRETP
ncbi:MAG: type II toxin-antitoxin system ParD family antitoxin [Planctomycetota bacterium]|nr:type II toxin-antitoxin system ParD family antitoxin [Planctomycetota bacterium]